jgi:DMSO/TMAO reductase YedYZ molybdopterin-dependent catalytic subunit
MRNAPHRRSVLRGAFTGAAALTLGGCQPLSDKGWVKRIISLGEAINIRVQRALLGSDTLAPEFTEADLSPIFKPNGSTDPQSDDYRRLAAKNFADFKLVVDGLVEKPAALSLTELRAMPSRTQITRHDCVEGWSAIGKWKGVPLAAVLDRVGVKKEAQYVVFHCFDTMEQGAKGPVPYYESLDFVDARHPQTILAYEMNDRTLPIPHGAPLRVRVERQLGYKMAKYVHRVEVVDDLSRFGEGKGSYWADRGYDWFAGI